MRDTKALPQYMRDTKALPQYMRDTKALSQYMRDTKALPQWTTFVACCNDPTREKISHFLHLSGRPTERLAPVAYKAYPRVT